MKKLRSSLKNMLLVLTGVTVVSVALLAYVNKLTEAPIAASKAKALNDALKKVLPPFTNNPEKECDTIFGEKGGKPTVDFIIYPAKDGERTVGTAVQSSALGFGGDLKVLVGFDADGNIYNYSLLEHVETPGLGSKADRWFGAFDPSKDEKAVRHEESAKSIIGLNPGTKPLAVTKDQDGIIDAITASTITSRAFLNAVNKAYKAYKNEGGAVDSTSGATPQAANTDSTSGATPQATDTVSGATQQVEPADTTGVNE
ncbi:MAG: RnfABCDGE type electron transport complex subunit G [Mediterranea sp.]|jgi:electron transport complex protein RnfG|nr:RnfABCDGE type electron transport complex subunit G [Mediterranea sp.]